ncbi:MAG: type II toxin-antitoxin system VapC family toxin [Deltaproteobacteria bacterium]|nr:type II toxin-antitoxin system VapC family toxin [Deltaproteobacteria bacterium]
MPTSWLIDSNVLVYAFFHRTEEASSEDPQKCLRLDSRQVMTLAAQNAFSGVVAQQNLLEFLAIVTSPKRVASPVDLREALTASQAYLSFCTLVTPKPSTYLTFEALTRERRVARERLFDLYLAATAMDNDVSQICTWNTKHFRRLAGLWSATPSQVLKFLDKEQARTSTTSKTKT